jgi:hypothetical protein
MNVSQIMETNTTIVANAEPGVQTEDFAQRVRVNHAKFRKYSNTRFRPAGSREY